MLRRLFPSLAGAASAAPKPLAHRPILKRDAERMRLAGDGGFVLLVTMGDAPVGRTTAVERLGRYHRGGVGCPAPINVARPEYR